MHRMLNRLHLPSTLSSLTRPALALAIAVMAVPFAGCEEAVPTELEPFFTPILDLPGLPDGETGTFEMTISNTGSTDVNVDSVAIAEDPDAPGQDGSFGAELDSTTILADDEGNLRVTYETPGGEAQAAIIVITSDAEVNPTLEIPVNALAYEPPAPADGGTEPTDSGTPADAGNPPNDAGNPPADSGTPADAGNPPADAGNPPADAGTPADSGTPADAGSDTDAGAAADAGTPADAGSDTDAGASDAGN